MSTKPKYVIPYQYKNDPLIESIIKDISKYNPLGYEAEIVLFKEYNDPSTSKKRRDEIKCILVNSNMRFALDYSLQYINFNINLADLISCCKLGLIYAVDLFDHTKGIKFMSWAVWHIKSHVSKLLETNDLIVLPSHKKVKLNKLKKNIDDISDLSDEYKYLNELTQPYKSYDSPVDGESELKISDVIADQNSADITGELERKDIFFNIKDKIKTKLSDEEYSVISYLFGLNEAAPLGLKEVGDILGKSHERVRQLKTSSLRKLKNSPELASLSREYLMSS